MYIYIIIIIITEWASQATPVVVTPWSEQAGPRVPLPHDPLSLFSLFFDDSLVGLIVEETNRYAEECLRGTNKQWSTNAEEVRAYMGFLILMGINHLPEIRDYWSTDNSLRYSAIADRMTGLRRSRGICTSSITTTYLLLAKKVFLVCRRLILESPPSKTDSNPPTTPIASSV